MQTKKAAIFAVCFLLIVFAGCSRSKGSTWETGANFEVSDTGSAEKKEFSYQVFDNQNKVIDSACTGGTEPVFYADNDFLRLSLNYGTGAAKYRYYDVSKGLASGFYQSVLADRFTKDGILIAYLTHEDGIVVVAVRDAFDEKAFYKTFKGEHPIIFSPSAQAEFISDDQLKITYLTGEDYDEKTELLTIR